MQQSSIDIILFHQNKLILRASLLYIECVHVCVCFVLLDLYLFIQYRRFEYVSVCVSWCLNVTLHVFHGQGLKVLVDS